MSAIHPLMIFTLMLLASLLSPSLYAQRIERAQIWQGQAWQPVALPDRWEQHADRAGAWWYRVEVNIDNNESLKGVYIRRACNHVQVYANGALLWRPAGAQQGQYVQRWCHYPMLVAWPSHLQHRGKNVLWFRLYSDSAHQIASLQRTGHLSAIEVAAWDEMAAVYSQEYFVRVRLNVILTALMLIGGAAILLLWWRYPRDRLYGYFGLLQVVGAVGISRALWVEPWLPNVWLEHLILVIALVVSVIFCALVEVYLKIDTPQRQRLGAFILGGLIVTALMLPHDWLLQGSRVLYALALLLVLSVVVRAGRAVLIQSTALQKRLFMVVTLCVVLATIHDYLVLLGDLPDIERPLIQMVMPMLVVMLLIHMVLRYASLLEQAERDQDILEQRVEMLGREIEHSYQHMLKHQQHVAAQAERERIAQDLHDDLGARLLTMVHQSSDRASSQTAQEALIDLRMLIQGLQQQTSAMLDEVLAQCRQEIAARCEATHRRLIWQDETQQGYVLGAKTHVTVLRLLREAVTNVIKHTNSIELRVHVAVRGALLMIELEDDGQGVPVSTWQMGMGMCSMRQRAQQIDAQLIWCDRYDDQGQRLGSCWKASIPLS